MKLASFDKNCKYVDTCMQTWKSRGVKKRDLRRKVLATAGVGLASEKFRVRARVMAGFENSKFVV